MKKQIISVQNIHNPQSQLILSWFAHLEKGLCLRNYSITVKLSLMSQLIYMIKVTAVSSIIMTKSMMILNLVFNQNVITRIISQSNFWSLYIDIVTFGLTKWETPRPNWKVKKIIIHTWGMIRSVTVLSRTSFDDDDNYTVHIQMNNEWL